MELEELYIELKAYLKKYYRPQSVSQSYSNQNTCGFISTFSHTIDFDEDDLSEYINANLEDDFSRKLLQLISKRERTNPEVYEAACMRKQKFSHIISSGKAKKEDIFKFALVLQLTLTELEELLKTVGLAISNSIKTDLIVRWFFEHQIYDKVQIELALEKFNGESLFNND